ncbi:hypothetical protein M514_23308 [Trichuris suis]|uniref:Uncharacterized protein n=1 Tax=Trichuris suis TaxID=68888 RepID=A0A085N4R5_9BILA|nr:hypothetical protein M514_23308 [Trichuris suis]
MLSVTTFINHDHLHRKGVTISTSSGEREPEGGRKCGAIRRRRTGARTESVSCNCGCNCRIQCALMHCKTESGPQEVRSTDELMRLSGVTQRDAGKEVLDVVADQHVIFLHLNLSDLSEEFLRVEASVMMFLATSLLSVKACRKRSEYV